MRENGICSGRWVGVMRGLVGAWIWASSLLMGGGAQAQQGVVDSPPLASGQPVQLQLTPAQAEAMQRGITPWRLMELQYKRERLVASSRSMAAPVTLLALGVSSMIVGGGVFAIDLSSIDAEFDLLGEVWGPTERTGLVLMPVGASLALFGAIWTAVRGLRRGRLRRLNRLLEAPDSADSPLAFTPRVGRHGASGHLGVRF